MNYVTKKTSAAHGYYQVGDSTYNNKTEAFYYASTRLIAGTSWQFHPEVFNNINWSIKPNTTLKELYKLRAEQIRSKYDYLVVWFSGGTDSYYMLKSFLDNGIIPDEIFSFWEFEASDKYLKTNRTDISGANRHSEYEFAAKPVLEWVAKNYPQINIVTYDITKDLFSKELSEQTFLSSNHWLTIGSFVRYSARSEFEKAARAQGKSIGVAIGIDKILTKRSPTGDFYAYFKDGPCIPDNDTSRDVDYFYWSPDCPEIPVLQSHILLEHFQANKNLLTLIENSTESDHMYELVYEDIIYPEYPKTFFQVKKSPFTFVNNEYDRWMFEHHSNHRTVEVWSNHMDQYFSKIKPMFKQRTGGLINLTSPMYKIGQIT